MAGLDFVGRVPRVLFGCADDFKEKFYKLLMQYISSSSYVLSCTAVQVMQELITAKLFSNHGCELLTLFVPTIHTLKGQPLLNVCDLVSSIMESIPKSAYPYITQLQQELLSCIQNNITDEIVVDICLTTLYSNLMLVGEPAALREIVPVTFQCLSSFRDSNDIISSVLRIMAAMYSKAREFMKDCINRSDNSFNALFEHTLPINNATVMNDAYGFLGDIVEGCPTFVAAHIGSYINHILELSKTFCDESLTSVVWTMLQCVMFIPSAVAQFVPTFAANTLSLLTRPSVPQSLQKNILAFAAKAMQVTDAQMYLPYLILLTGPALKSVLTIRRPEYLVGTLLGIGQLILQWPEVCAQNAATIKDVYSAASRNPQLSSLSHQILLRFGC